ncbi:hypothetical protein BC826DRAFT_479334 [Russula brevipes]|nr:hypothetical protein BC826DRAFT_479334 [Russula brevipes]
MCAQLSSRVPHQPKVVFFAFSFSAKRHSSCCKLAIQAPWIHDTGLHRLVIPINMRDSVPETRKSLSSLSSQEYPQVTLTIYRSLSER